MVFSGRGAMAGARRGRDGPAVCRVEWLPRVLRKRGRGKPLSWREVEDLYRRLEPYTQVSWFQKQAHIRQVKEKERARRGR